MQLIGDIYIYNSVNSMNINQNKTDHIPQGFLQFQTFSDYFFLD